MIQVKHPLSKTYLAESVYQTLLENILSGALNRGSELSEVGLASSLNVSRTPVHEAVQRLVKEGLIVQHPNRKLTVARFSKKEIREIYEMRVLLECAAAGRAATRISREDLADLKDRADRLDRDRGRTAWPAKAIEFDLHFHDVLARAAGNDRLREEIARTRLLVRAFCRITGSQENLEQAFREHLRILSAIEAKKSDAASKAMKEHIEARLETVMDELNSEEP